MAAHKHPSLNDSLILICSAMVFTVEKWDEYLVMTGMDVEDKEATEEIKEMYMHLIMDTHTHVERAEAIADMMQTLMPILFDKVPHEKDESTEEFTSPEK